MSELPPFSLSPQHSVLSTIFGSFRDPSGFLFFENGTLFRSVSRLYQQNYDHLLQSGLYNKLVEDDLLIPHREVQPPAEKRDDEYKIIQPEIVPFISYPYEWCFSQLKDIFPYYNQEHFEHAFNHHFLILKSQALPDTLRIIYLMKRKCLLN